MATTGIWKIQKRLDHVINYVIDVEKTFNSEYGNGYYAEFHNVDKYKELDYKNEKDCYVSGINCVPEYAYRNMMFTKKQYDKNSGILGYHAFQSFKENEVTSAQAHLIGVKLAEEMWGDRFEVIVATHQNTNHIHNHFVINSVSFIDGKKYYDNRENYALLRQTSDALCQEYGLSVIDKTNKKKEKVNYDNYYKGYVFKSNYHTLAKQDVDRAIAMAYSYKDFENLIIKMGYEIKNRYGKLSIRRDPFKKNIRIERAFGNDYSIESIEKRIEIENALRIPFIETYNPNKRIKSYKRARNAKTRGIYGLYKYYCYILKVYPRHYPKKVLTPALRLEVEKMDEISKQTRLLVSNKIETYEQLLLYKENLKTDIQEVSSKREYLWKKIKRVKTDEEKNLIRCEIDRITQLLFLVQQKKKLCDGIEKRLNIIQENIKEFEEANRKEREKDEFKRSS